MKKEMTPRRKEIIKNLSITISKESKKVNGRNIKLIETLQKILDKNSNVMFTFAGSELRVTEFIKSSIDYYLE